MIAQKLVEQARNISLQDYLDRRSKVLTRNSHYVDRSNVDKRSWLKRLTSTVYYQ